MICFGCLLKMIDIVISVVVINVVGSRLVMNRLLIDRFVMKFRMIRLI